MSHQVMHTIHPGIGPNPAKRRRHRYKAADKSACQEPSAALPAHEHLPAENANDCPDLVACRALLVADIRATIVRLKPTDARALHVIWRYLPSAPGGQHDTPVLRLRLQCRRVGQKPRCMFAVRRAEAAYIAAAHLLGKGYVD